VTRRLLIGVVIVACLAAACDGGSPKAGGRASSTTTPAPRTPPATVVLPRRTPAKSDCALNVDNEAFTGRSGTASAIGWAGNAHGVVTCLGGRFYVQGDI